MKLTNVEEVRKAYISFLGKLTLPEPEEVEEWKIRAIQTLILAIPEVRLRSQFINMTS